MRPAAIFTKLQFTFSRNNAVIGGPYYAEDIVKFKQVQMRSKQLTHRKTVSKIKQRFIQRSRPRVVAFEPE
jgi:hypothetical protein